MIQTHLTVEGGEQWLSWAYGRERALRTLGTPYMTRRWDMGDGTTVTVRITPDASYIELKGSVGNYAVRPSDMTAPAIDMKAAVQDGSKQVGIVKDEPKLKSKKDCPKNVGNVDWLSTDGDVQLSWDAPGWNRYPTYMLSDNESPKAYNSFYNTSTYIYHKDQKVELRRSTGEAIGVLGVAVATLGGAKYLVCAGRHENGSAGTTQFFVVPFQQIGNSKYAYMTPVGSVTGPYTPYPFYFSSDGSRCCSLATNGYIFWGTQFALLTTDFKSENGRIFVETTYNESDNIAVWAESGAPTYDETGGTPVYTPGADGYSYTFVSSFSRTNNKSEAVKTPIGVDFVQGSNEPVVVFLKADRTQIDMASGSSNTSSFHWNDGSVEGTSVTRSESKQSKVVDGAILFGTKTKAAVAATDDTTRSEGTGGWSLVRWGETVYPPLNNYWGHKVDACRLDSVYLDVRFDVCSFVERHSLSSATRPNAVLTESWGGSVKYSLGVGNKLTDAVNTFSSSMYGYEAIQVKASTGIHGLFDWMTYGTSAKTFASRRKDEWLAAAGYTAKDKQDLLSTADWLVSPSAVSPIPQEQRAEAAASLRNLAGCLPQPIVIASNGADVKAHFKGGDMFHIRQVVTL